MKRASLIALAACLAGWIVVKTNGWADERRAPAPAYSDKDIANIFFEDLSDVFRGPKPSIASLRKSSAASVAGRPDPARPTGTPAPAGNDVWAALISPASIEDEVKRLKLHFDSVVTTPGAFNGGGYQEARLDLTVLAMMFAVINEHGGEVRWKEDAAAARDLLARTAFNCKAGSTQVYNEAKLRKADLQDLVSGSGLSARDAQQETDWSMTADRSPLMEYADLLADSLEDASRNAGSINDNLDKIRREAELISVFGEVLTQEGMEDGDDEDYQKLSRSMMEASRSVVAALERGDTDAVRTDVAAIRQRCDNCHADYR